MDAPEFSGAFLFFVLAAKLYKDLPNIYFVPRRRMYLRRDSSILVNKDVQFRTERL